MIINPHEQHQKDYKQIDVCAVFSINLIMSIKMMIILIMMIGMMIMLIMVIKMMIILIMLIKTMIILIMMIAMMIITMMIMTKHHCQSNRITHRMKNQESSSIKNE